MNFDFSPEENAFREEVSRFISDNYPKHLTESRRAEFAKEDFLSWHRVLAEKGWVAPHWPEEFGGPGWSVTQRYIFDDECAKANTLIVLPFGITMLGPVLMHYANDAQKAHYLPRILSGEDWWCQGYSEPGSGSDLASLKTKAEHDGDDYVVNGHKIWTTLAQHADWMFCLVRTSQEDKPQKGISFLLIDMNSPGIEVRPIITIDGSHEVNEVFLTDVRVPAENLVGEEGNGWGIAKFLLGNERTGIAGVARSKNAVKRLKEISCAELVDGEPLIEDMDFKKKISELEIDLLALEYTELRTLAAESAGRGPGAESSILKIKGTEIQQKVTELIMEAVGTYSLPKIPMLDTGANYNLVGPDYSHGVSQSYFNMRKTAIYGGTNEVQRNIIAKFVLGL